MSGTLPVGVLLGTDTPELSDLLMVEKCKATEDALAVTTRAESRWLKIATEESNRNCGVQPHGLVTDHLLSDADENNGIWMRDLSEEMFEGGKEKTRQSRREKRAERRKWYLQNDKEEDLEEEGKDEQGSNMSWRCQRGS